MFIFQDFEVISFKTYFSGRRQRLFHTFTMRTTTDQNTALACQKGAPLGFRYHSSEPVTVQINLEP
jgi:hypothetical protein